jgi:hypothetical protein
MSEIFSFGVEKYIFPITTDNRSNGYIADFAAFARGGQDIIYTGP